MSDPIPEIPPRMDKDIWKTYVANRVWEKGVGFICRKNGDYYEAVNGSTGKIGYGGSDGAGNVVGTDSQAVINAAITASINGGTVFIRAGDYGTISITLKTNVRLIIEKSAITITVSIDSGATCVIEDWNAGRIRYYKAGSLVTDLDLDAGTINIAEGGLSAADVLISGATKLSDWRHASDLTKIDGDDVYANSIPISKLASDATVRMFTSQVLRDLIEAWRYASTAYIDGADLYSASVPYSAMGSGALEKGVSYIIRKNGDYYEAINGITGKIDYGGSGKAGDVDGIDCPAVIQAALDDAYGRVVFRKGTYPTGNTTLTINHGNVFLDGEIELSDMSEEQAWNQGGGVKLLGDGSTLMLEIEPDTEDRNHVLECIRISNICFDGGASSQSAGKHLIHARYVAELFIDHCGLRKSADDGIYLEDGNEIIWINNNDISLNYGSGVDVYADGATDGIHQLHIESNHLWNNHEYGIKINDASTSLRIGDVFCNYNSVRESYKHGLFINNIINSEIIGNSVHANDYEDSATYSGLAMEDCANIRVLENRFYDNDKYEVWWEDNDNCIFSLNDLSGTDHEAMFSWTADLGTGNDFSHNRGWITENQGEATFPSGASNYTFPHGLFSTPRTVSLNWKSNIGDKSWYWGADATNITVYLSSGTADADKYFSWYATYWPSS